MYILLQLTMLWCYRPTLALQCRVAGHKLSMPIIVAPMSQQRMADDEGELAVARAVAKEGTAMVSMHAISCTYEMPGASIEALHALCFFALLYCDCLQVQCIVPFICNIVFFHLLKACQGIQLCLVNAWVRCMGNTNVHRCL